MNIEEDANIDVGEVWELSHRDHPEPDPPHHEDVLVSEGKKIDALSDVEVRDLILQNEDPWAGSPEALFDGIVAATANGRVYVPSDGPLPSRSTGYWLPDDELIKHIALPEGSLPLCRQ